jgi:Glycosyltransferase family 28 N-terminal domain
MTTDSAAREVSYPSDSVEVPRPSSPREDRATSSEAARPALSKQWQTERPKPTTKASIFEGPGLKRHATNASKLNEAIWNSLDNDDDESTTSSSEDEDDDGTQAPKHQRGRARGRQSRGSRGSYSRFNVGNDDFNTKGRVSRRDGRLNISVKETNNRGYLAKALGATFLKHLGSTPDEDMTGVTPVTSQEGQGKYSRASSESTLISHIPRPKLNIVVMVIGSRGDIQPFLKLGKNLKEYGHRVRIATHPAFKDFVQKDSGLEFFSVGGDPAELMAFMVKNPGMIPTMDTLKKGEVGRRRDQMAEMFEGFWRACINATDDEKDISNLKMMGEKAVSIILLLLSSTQAQSPGASLKPAFTCAFGALLLSSRAHS